MCVVGRGSWGGGFTSNKPLASHMVGSWPPLVMVSGWSFKVFFLRKILWYRWQKAYLKVRRILFASHLLSARARPKPPALLIQAVWRLSSLTGSMVKCQRYTSTLVHLQHQRVSRLCANWLTGANNATAKCQSSHSTSPPPRLHLERLCSTIHW